MECLCSVQLICHKLFKGKLEGIEKVRTVDVCIKEIGSDGIEQGSSNFQIVRATLTISMMPAGHKAIKTYMYTSLGKSGPSVSLTTNRYILCRQLAGLGFVVIFSKRPAGHGKELCGPRVEDPWYRALVHLVMSLDVALREGILRSNSSY
jgi:hypothetical protein